MYKTFHAWLRILVDTNLKYRKYKNSFISDRKNTVNTDIMINYTILQHILQVIENIIQILWLKVFNWSIEYPSYDNFNININKHIYVYIIIS